MCVCIILNMYVYVLYVIYILYTHTYIDTHTEYYSALNEIMPLAATWMDLEISILSEVNQKDKDKYHRTWLICRI